MRISDWSSDVCSSDLIGRAELGDFALHPDVEIIDREVDRRVGQEGKLRRQDGAGHPSARGFRPQLAKTALRKGGGGDVAAGIGAGNAVGEAIVGDTLRRRGVIQPLLPIDAGIDVPEIGRASWRERVCTYV